MPGAGLRVGSFAFGGYPYWALLQPLSLKQHRAWMIIQALCCFRQLDYCSHQGEHAESLLAIGSRSGPALEFFPEFLGHIEGNLQRTVRTGILRLFHGGDLAAAVFF